MDEIDRSILYELGRDARQTYSGIAKKIGSKKQVVAYRIQNLIKTGTISKFAPIVALSKIGVYSFKMYIRLHGVTSEKGILAWLIDMPEVAWVAKAIGGWDLLLGVYSTNPVEFGKVKESIFTKLSPFIEEYSVIIIEDAFVCNRDYLVRKKLPRKNFVFGGPSEVNLLDSDEQRLLQLIANDGRFRLIDVANELRLDVRTVQAKLASLRKRGILQGFTAFVDLSKMSMQLHKLCIYLAKHDEGTASDILSYLKANDNAVHFSRSIGPWDLEVELELEPNLIYSVVSRLKAKFPSNIKKVDVITITDELKLEFFPNSTNHARAKSL